MIPVNLVSIFFPGLEVLQEQWLGMDFVKNNRCKATGIGIFKGRVIEARSGCQNLKLGCVLICWHVILRLWSLVQAFLVLSIFKVFKGGGAFNHCICLILGPNMCRATRHEGECIQHLCSSILEWAGLDSDGQVESLKKPFGFCSVSTELLWISRFYGGFRGGLVGRRNLLGCCKGSIGCSCRIRALYINNSHWKYGL